MSKGCGAGQVAQNQKISANPVTLPDGSTSANALQLLDTNLDNREELILQNVGIVTVYVGLGFPPTATSYSFSLLPCGSAHDGLGGVYISDIWKGSLFAIGQSAGAQVALTEEVS